MQLSPKVADLEAQLESLEARGVELESRLSAGTATPAECAELTRVQAEVDFFFTLLEGLGVFNSREQ
ncbi:MAG: hypothetical protein ABI645_01720 [Pseudomonadota bacterium]